MEHVVNWELLSHPLNWIIVFLILYAAALSTQFIMGSMGKLHIQL